MRVLCSSGVTNDLGLVSRLLPVAAELRANGHDVAFANSGSASTRLIADAGFPNLRWPVELDPLGPRNVTIPIEFPLVDAEQAMCLIYGDPDYTATEVENWKQLISEWRAEVVLDTFCPAACAAALIERTPLVEILQADFHPDSTFAWWEPPRPSPSAVGSFNPLLAAAGVDEVDRVTRLTVQGSSAVVGCRSTDPVSDATLSYAGSLTWGNAGDSLPAAIPRPGERPLVFLYGGNPDYVGQKSSGVVVDATVEALGSQDIDVVLAAGNQVYPERLPPNFIAVPYASGPALIQRADLMIHHGGHGSYLMALAAGKPAVSIPTYAERESNARRLAGLGAGVCLVPTGDQLAGQHLDPRLLSDAVRVLLEESSYADAARRVRDELAALPGAAGVAEMVEAAVR
jgi:UDP:flavonoid glycosyltransferase YjiC (YdhE family)